MSVIYSNVLPWDELTFLHWYTFFWVIVSNERASWLCTLLYNLSLFQISGDLILRFFNCNRFTHQGYNFYILPCSDDFVCQTESLVFLVKNGMDLNKVFSDGKIYNYNITIDITMAYCGIRNACNTMLHFLHLFSFLFFVCLLTEATCKESLIFFQSYYYCVGKNIGFSFSYSLKK
jgi:hypothetical protein